MCVCSAVGTAKLHFPCETNKWKIQVLKRRELIYSPKMPSKLLKENHDNTLWETHTFFHFAFYFPWKQRRRNCVNLIKLIFFFRFWCGTLFYFHFFSSDCCFCSRVFHFHYLLKSEFSMPEKISILICLRWNIYLSICIGI